MVWVIVFYLLQFYIFLENDVWWGVGFIEWINVWFVKFMFFGYYQLYELLDIGYYDLIDFQVQECQIELVKFYGIGGFCFYWYWFDGKWLMEKLMQ